MSDELKAVNDEPPGSSFFGGRGGHPNGEMFGEVLDKFRTKLLDMGESFSDKRCRLFDIVELIEATVAHRF